MNLSMERGGHSLSSLKELIEQGQYELAAYRLIYGVVQAHVEQRQVRGASGHVRGVVRRPREGRVAQMGSVSDG